jgi:hypothetical protein
VISTTRLLPIEDSKPAPSIYGPAEQWSDFRSAISSRSVGRREGDCKPVKLTPKLSDGMA